MTRHQPIPGALLIEHHRREAAARLDTVTRQDGTYAFTGLPPAVYTVAEVPQDGWAQTLPAPPLSALVR